MEILIFKILKLSPYSVFNLETCGLFYLVENLVLYSSTIRYQAIPHLVTKFIGECKKNSKENAIIFINTF